MNTLNKKLEKRVPIRKRVLTTVLQTMLIAIIAASITGFFCIRWIEKSSEKALGAQLEENIKSILVQKAVSADARLEHYEKYIEFITDYIEGMYINEDKLIEIGNMYYAPGDTKEYALTRAFANRDLNPDDFTNELLFFSNLEHIWEPIAKSNENLITTVYAGTKSGLLTSYDKWSYLSIPTDGDTEMIYDYFQSEWYKKGENEDGVFYTSLYVDSQGRGLTITVASPFYNEKGEFMGVDCADYDITGLFDDLLNFGLDETMLPFALDDEGNIILPGSDFTSVEEYTGLTETELITLRTSQDGILRKNDTVYVSTPISRLGWTLCVSVPTYVIQDSIKETEKSIFYAMMTFIAIAVVIILFSIFAANKVSKNITKPMEQLGRDMKIISDGNLHYRATVMSNDEIGDVTNQMNDMVDKLNSTKEELQTSQQHADELSILATKDALTGVSNKTAYDDQVILYTRDLENGNKNFGFVMIDINYLKQINDTYGHDKGDLAIKKLSSVICDVYYHSPVYRIGGDEFVVALKGHDYENASDLYNQFNKSIDSITKDESLEPWERISAAIGYALFDESKDDCVESVLVRADKEMYKCKSKMKSKR